MVKTVILGIAGARGSGKDTVYKAIQDLFAGRKDVSVHRTAFADPIKQVIKNIFNLHDDTYDRLKRANVVELRDSVDTITYVGGRDIVRGIGMLMRGYDNGLQFDSYVINCIDAISDDPNNPAEIRVVVVTDVRFPTDATIIKRRDGHLILVRRPGFEYDGHITETPLNQFDFEIENNGSIETLKEKIKSILNQLGVV